MTVVGLMMRGSLISKLFDVICIFRYRKFHPYEIDYQQYPLPLVAYHTMPNTFADICVTQSLQSHR